MHIVVMAGGSGTRFWPMSRVSRPKQFLNIVGDKPMVVATCERVSDLAPDERIFLVVGRPHKEETEQLFAGRPVNIVVEPVGRNTAPCIGLAALLIERMGGGMEPMCILPADHYIAKPELFREGLRKAADVARGGGIVTLGIVPTRPETGYGYIERSASGPSEESVHRVQRFVEKPDLASAAAYMQSGSFYWNAGIFVASPRTLLDELSIHMPAFHEGLMHLPDTDDPPLFASELSELYRKTESVSFDYAIMEKTSRPVFVIPCDCGWSDVGSWYSLYEVRRPGEQDSRGNVTSGEPWMEDCRDSLVISSGKRWIAALGLNKVLIVDTEDALLVADIERSQDIKRITAHLEKTGRKDLL